MRRGDGGGGGHGHGSHRGAVHLASQGQIIAASLPSLEYRCLMPTRGGAVVSACSDGLASSITFGPHRVRRRRCRRTTQASGPCHWFLFTNAGYAVGIWRRRSLLPADISNSEKDSNIQELSRGRWEEERTGLGETDERAAWLRVAQVPPVFLMPIAGKTGLRFHGSRSGPGVASGVVAQKFGIETGDSGLVTRFSRPIVCDVLRSGIGEFLLGHIRPSFNCPAVQSYSAMCIQNNFWVL